MARKSAAEKAADRKAATAAGGAGHNLPPRADYDAFLDRLHIINDRMDEDRATHMGDINAVYEEAADTLDMPKEVFAAIFKADRKEQKAQKKAAKADTRTRQAYEKVAAAYGDDSPLGQWAGRMAKAAGKVADASKASDKADEPDAEQSEEAAAAEAEE
jgi:hypothetical protein